MNKYKILTITICTVALAFNAYNFKCIKGLRKKVSYLENSVGSVRVQFPSEPKETISRDAFLKSIQGLNVKSLEVGPYFNASLKGKNVKYFDVFDKPTLIKLGKNDKNVQGIVNNRKQKIEDVIPNIDYVEPTGDMSIIHEKFDLVYSSHNIEHQVDLIRHLQQVESLLNTGGSFYLFIPDKRYCFDHYVPETPLSEVIATHVQGAKTHSLQVILASNCELTHNEAGRHWNNDHGIQPKDEDLGCYKRGIEQYNSAKGGYIDAHKWRLTPKTFLDIINKLYALGYIKLKVKKVYDTAQGSHEFSAILEKA